jgi:acetate kinase
MNVLVLNSGSSSLKYKLIRMPGERTLSSGTVERIGEGKGRARFLRSGFDGGKEVPWIDCADHAQALGWVLDALKRESWGDADAGEILLAGHRLVHGGDLFSRPTLVDDPVFAQLESIQELAPLHMPPALAVLRACRALLPRARQVACFDTTFFCSMPAKSTLYAVPREWHITCGVRRFGFHGLSHQYVTQCAAEMLGIAWKDLKLISAHLGNGASMTAFDRGRVLDTSMGFTPLEGLIMGTRCGYLDPAALLHIHRCTGMGLEQMVETLNTRSGLYAVSGIGRDLRAIMEARENGHPEAALAVEMYVHTLRKYVGAYHFALSGAHALVFTGGVGENAAEVRALVLSGWEELGLILDAEANRDLAAGRAGVISAGPSKVKILVIPTDEERMIARQAYARFRSTHTD